MLALQLTSEKFQDKLANYEVDDFLKGFRECHHQFHKLYPDLDISELKEVYNDDRDD